MHTGELVVYRHKNLFRSLAVLDPRLATQWMYFLYLSLSSVDIKTKDSNKQS